MKLFLVRHAQSENNVLWGEFGTDDLKARSADPQITDTGHHQAALLAKHLVDQGLIPKDNHEGRTYLYCSLMTRSIQTAEYLRQETGIPLTALEDVFEKKGLYEIDDAGIEVSVEGPGRQYFEERFPELKLPDTLTDKGWWNRPVETEQDFLNRVISSLENLIQEHGHENHDIFLVAHGDYLDEAINVIMSTPRNPHNYQSSWVANWVFHNTSISCIDIQEKARNVIYLNRINHLPEKFVTW